MRTKKTELVEEKLVEINKKFHEKQLVDESFYQQLLQQGFVYRHSLLVSIFPDSSNTYFGKIIRQDGNVFEFDVDLDEAECSSWHEITADFREYYEKNKRVKPWLVEVVASKLFNELIHSTKSRGQAEVPPIKRMY
jgi:hypothetical protein